MLHSQDKNMVLMDTSDPHSLYKMDLTRGEVVEEWVRPHPLTSCFSPSC
jgi:hypothetical protein